MEKANIMYTLNTQAVLSEQALRKRANVEGDS